MEILNEVDMSVVTTTASNSEFVDYSASNNAKTSRGEDNDLSNYLESNKENLILDETNINDSDNLLFEKDFLSDNNRESFSEYNGSDTEMEGCEELVMMVPDLDSTLKFKHDTERFFMTLSIAEAELDLAKSASRTSKLAMGDDFDISSRGGTNCLKEIRNYVEELLDTVNDVRDSNFGIQRIVEECNEILQQSVSQSNLSQIDTMDMNTITDQNLVSIERLKLLCEAVSEENSRLKKEIDILNNENEFLIHRVDHEEESSLQKEKRPYNYFRNNPIMRLFFFIFILAMFSPANISNGLQKAQVFEQQSVFSEIASEFLDRDYKFSKINTLQLLEKSLKGLKFEDTSSQGHPDTISICSILSELDVLEKCFTRIRLS
ncbi:transmembrane domain-containing protein [Cryptosporidium hominis]